MSVSLAVDPTLDRVPDSARLLRALAGLSIVGASIAMSMRFAAMPKLNKFIASNALASDDRTEILVTAALGAVLPALLAGCVSFFARRGAPALVETASRLLAPLALCGLLPLLFCAQAWRTRPLPFLALLSLTVVLTAVTTALALQAAPMATSHVPPALRSLLALGSWPARALERRATALVIVCVAGLASVAFAQRSEIWLVIQTAAVGMAALPLFLFAQTQLSRPAAVLLALAYLVFAPVRRAMLDDFHWIALLPFVAFVLCYAIARRNRWLIALSVASLAAGLVPAWRTTWEGVAIADAIRTLAINPAYVVTTLLTEAKLVFCLHMLAPLAFLPLRRPALALLVIPAALLTLLVPEGAAADAFTTQSSSLWLPYLFGVSVLALRLVAERFGPAHARAALAALALGVLAHSHVFGAPAPDSKSHSRRSRGPLADSMYIESAFTAGSCELGEIEIRRSRPARRSIRDQLPSSHS